MTISRSKRCFVTILRFYRDLIIIADEIKFCKYFRSVQAIEQFVYS